MNSDFRILSCLSDDDKLLLRKIDDCIRISENKYMLKFSFFLDERQSKIVNEYLILIKFNNFKFCGGYENAKRQIVMIYPDYFNDEEMKFPIVALKFSYREQDKLSHRDFLGCLMSFQIKRELIGDIVVSKGETIIFIYETIAGFVVHNTKKVGNVGVQVRRFNGLNFKIEDKFECINGSVASFRLDCVISLVTGLSREKSAQIIKSNGIDINYLNIRDIKYILKPQDVFSFRGYGKYILDSENGISKKGRKHITIKKYI